MTIQDKAIELSTDQQVLTGTLTSPYVPGSVTIPVGTLENLVMDIGLGAELVMEFEVTTAFTGYAAANAIPHLVMGVAVSDSPILATNISIIATVGWPLSATTVELGMQPSDSLVVPNLYEGDRYYCKIPGGVYGLPWLGSGGVRNDKATPPGGLIPGNLYLGAIYYLPMNATTAVQSSNPALWTATDFSAGKISTRILPNQPVADGVHHYASKMQVK